MAWSGPFRPENPCLSFASRGNTQKLELLIVDYFTTPCLHSDPTFQPLSAVITMKLLQLTTIFVTAASLVVSAYTSWKLPCMDDAVNRDLQYIYYNTVVWAPNKIFR